MTNPALAFNGVSNKSYNNSAFIAPSINGFGNTVGKNWGTGNDYIINRFTFVLPNDWAVIDGGNFKLEGSTNGIVWQDIYVGNTTPVAGMTVDIIQADIGSTDFPLVAYQYHRLNLQGDGINAVAVAQLTLYAQNLTFEGDT